jgi:8-oxo-dGTP diphosphatase
VSDKRTNYVAGFMFSADRRYVALIRKQKPDWQRGKLNAIGGKIEETDENPTDAMVREFKEETGVLQTQWRHFCVLKFRGGEIHFFETTGDLMALQSAEAEQVAIFRTQNIEDLQTIPNLRWLIPLAMDKDGVTAVVEDNS